MTSKETRKRDSARLTASLLKLARSYRRTIDRSLAEHNISDARAVTVMQIARAGAAMRQRELAEAMGIEGPSLVRLLDQVCSAGLVERHPDPVDGRAKTLHLTTQGDELAAVVEDVLHGLRGQLLANVSDDDLAATLRVFDALDATLARLADTEPV